MHYIIDGYNLLFKSEWAGKLQDARQKLIEELDNLAGSLNLHITIVFDAPLQTDAIRRGHYRTLELIFTSRGESADDYIAEHAGRTRHKTTVITSDRKLARRVQGEAISVECAQDFLQRLRKRSRKKKPLQVEKVSPTPCFKKTIPAKVEEEGLPPLSNIEAWTAIFEAKYKADYKKKK